MVNRIIHVVLVLLLIGSSSCSEEMSRRLEPKSQALDRANVINVIADEALWNSPTKDSFEYYFEAAYPILPQPEPLFDIRHYTPIQLSQNELRKELRTYLMIADLSDPNSPTAKMILKDLGESKANQAKTDPNYHSAVGYNKWANGQLMIYLFANGKEDLQEQIAKNFSSIAKKVNEFDEEKIFSTVYVKGSNSDLSNRFKEMYSATLDIPTDYFSAIQQDKTMWLRRETDIVSMNIMITEVPYKSEAQLTKDGIKAVRNSLGKKYVSSDEEGSYMVTNDEDLPMFINSKNIGSAYGIEARGIWEMENDFMGGPFIHYAILSPDKKRIIYMDGFIHAPSKEKRKYMQYLEVIFNSFKFAETQ